MTIAPPAAADRWRAGPHRPLAPLALLAAGYVVAVGSQVPEMLSIDSAKDVLVAMLPLLLLALGQSFVLMVGRIDLSVTASMSFASVVGAALISGQLGGPLGDRPGWLAGHAAAVPAAIATFVAITVAVAALVGACAVWLRMPAFLVSLAAMMFFAGAALWFVTRIAGSSSIGDLPPGFVRIGYGHWLGVSIAALLAGAMALAAHLLVARSLLGHWWRAIGQNADAARASGVPVDAAVWLAFVANGLFAGAAAVLLAARLETGTPLLAERGMLLDILGAAVIGGASLYGGRGSVPGIVAGVLLLAVLDKGLQLLGLSLFLVLAIKGAVILFAAALDAWGRR